MKLLTYIFLTVSLVNAEAVPEPIRELTSLQQHLYRFSESSEAHKRTTIQPPQNVQISTVSGLYPPPLKEV